MNVSVELKSITSFRPCIVITILIILMIPMKGIVAKNKHKDVIADLPKAEDLDKYLSALETLVDFYIKHKVNVDLNMEFGLFLINVNLKSVLHKKRKSMSSKARFRIEQLMKKSHMLADNFHYKVEKNIDIKVSRLFYNESTWPNHLVKFNVDLLNYTKIYSPQQLEKIYGKWDNYVTNVYDFDKYKPTPVESDACMVVLSENPTNSRRSGTLRSCITPPHCKQGVNSGSDFGYGLTHRILFMGFAHFARGCSVFSLQEDSYKVDKYCIKSYNEAQFIASNDFKLPDLMMEQTVICGLFGHAQFLRTSWLNRLLEFQASEGCFKDNMPGQTANERMKEPELKISNLDQSMIGGKCHSHTTAVGAAILASTLRYIMENYY